MINRFSALLVLFLVSAVTFAQGINQMDAAGKRHGVWKGTYEKSKNPRYEGTFDHGKETGTFKFFEDDKTSTLAATRAFAADGSCITTFFDEKGKKVSEGKEVNKLREGEWKFYDPKTGKVLSTEPYVNGKIQGTRKVLFANGALAEEAVYIDGVKNGAYKQYTEKGIVLEESTYKNDKLDGPATFRDGHGDIVSKGQFTDNKKTGKWQFFEKGKKVREEDLTNKKTQLARKERKN
ncbi:toxin-antitoxin system YwqK family antitoxin [Flavobacterium hauense]